MLALQADLDMLEKWSSTWLLRFHPGKCKVLTFGDMENIPGRTYPYSLLNTVLEHVDEEKDLGVYVDSNLKFETHLAEKLKKANG